VTANIWHSCTSIELDAALAGLPPEVLAAWTRFGGKLVRRLAKAADVREPDVRWRLAHEKPWFNNQVAWLELDGRRAKFVLHKALPPDDGKGDPVMEQVFARSIEPNREFARA